MTALDWSIVRGLLPVQSGGGFYYKAAREEYRRVLLGGRNVPWWLAGTSMVATTFAADTPLASPGWSRETASQNWLWWNFVASGMLTVFFFSRLWRGPV